MMYKKLRRNVNLNRNHENKIWIGKKGHVPFGTSGNLLINQRSF